MLPCGRGVVCFRHGPKKFQRFVQSVAGFWELSDVARVGELQEDILIGIPDKAGPWRAFLGLLHRYSPFSSASISME